MRFRPSLGLTVTLLVIGLVFGRLGAWQLQREEQKRRLFDRFENAPVMTIEQALVQPNGFSRVEAYGRFDPDRHILIDNKIFEGRAGVHVVTPFYLETGGMLLVNRGWLPMAADRRKLPEVSTDAKMQLVSGLLLKPVTGGHRLGGDDILSKDQWPQLVTYFDLDSIGNALDTPLAPWILQLDPDHEAGFGDRQWQAAVMTPEVHRAYALQWFSLALATIIIWLTLGVRRGQKPMERKRQ